MFIYSYRCGVNGSWFDYSKDTSKLPLINRFKHRNALPGARNEISLLDSKYVHPNVYTAKARTGKQYVVTAVFDTGEDEKYAHIELEGEEQNNDNVEDETKYDESLLPPLNPFNIKR